ncbi:MAG TPA: T9SS type A sorting domain-containing protein [Ignavibacteriaceae bacterium]|nr:T9SS type A sorting domain-containing protein [Ignavibacteriaceae bacterium]
MKLALYMFVLSAFLFSASAQYANPNAYDVINATGTITVDGNMNEAAWNMVPATLVFGPNFKSTVTNLSVTGGASVKVDSLHGFDTTYTYLKVIKQGMKLYIGFTSMDKQVCKFGDSWEGDGLFMKIKNAANEDKEYKLYFNANGLNQPMIFENQAPGMGVGVKSPGTTTNDTTNIDSGYTAEMVIYLDSLGYTPATKSVQVLFNIFDPDYYHAGMLPWGTYGSYYKTWWGSEWGPGMKKLVFMDDPGNLTVLSTGGNLTIDGILNEPVWNMNFEHLLFGPGAVGDQYAKTVTGGTQVKTDSLGRTDTTFTHLKILHNGMKLYIGFYSNDKSVCKFGDSWEGEGVFLKIKNSANVDKEYKLYFNANGLNQPMIFENQAPGMGVGVKGSGTTTNDTTNIDNGYSAEMVIYLDSLGYTTSSTNVPIMINVFDPDFYQAGMVPWGPLGAFNKTWWGSEWGPTFRTLTLSPTILPVELTSFTANVVKEGVQLTWTTASEKNNQMFEVQRKSNNDFITIGTVNGKGTTAERTVYTFMDKDVNAGITYSYRLKQIDYDGSVDYSNIVTASGIAPREFALGQNYPNPFNPTSKINFSLPVKANVSLQVYNLLGQVVMTLANGQMEAGTYTFDVNASNLSSGIYVYQINANDGLGNKFTSSKKMVVLK